MLHLTFNNRLVAAVNDRFVSVWLPGTKRRRKVNLPVSMLRRDGSTWHLLMPATFTGMLMDQSNRYAARFDTGTLSEAFGTRGSASNRWQETIPRCPDVMRRVPRSTATTKCRQGNSTS